MAVHLYLLGRQQQQRGALPAAEKLLARAVAIHTATHGHDHPYVATDLQALAEVQEQLGDHEAAVGSRRRAERIWQAHENSPK